MGLIPGLGRSPGGGHGNPLQCSCLENPMDKGTWQATAHWVAESDTTEQLQSQTQLSNYTEGDKMEFKTSFQFHTL